MYVITGITGQVGGAVASSLLAEGRPVRGVVRDAEKGKTWERQGCEIAIADIGDARALAAAFRGADGVFLMVPPVFDPQPGFPEAQAAASVFRNALEEAEPKKVVYLSTIGAQAERTNLLTQHTIIERALRDLPIPVTFLRPGWFLENFRWDLPPVRETGVLSSFLHPLDKPVPMVGTAEIGRLAARLIQEEWAGSRVVELEGRHRVTPNQIATVLAKLLGRPVHAEVVPRERWEQIFRSQGMKNPEPRIQMLDGFNEGWIEFEGGEAESFKGTAPLESVMKTLVASQTE
ncbi:MAG TPA: NmrA family NAD(P)-binding protein [Bryobacteraceae bacterium]|jgi:uncharacterized protein YbjT (DUF2867 family)